MNTQKELWKRSEVVHALNRSSRRTEDSKLWAFCDFLRHGIRAVACDGILRLAIREKFQKLWKAKVKHHVNYAHLAATSGSPDMARCQELTRLSGSTSGEATSHDHLKWQGTRHFSAAAAQLGSTDEEIQYSGWVEKINNKGAVQPRVMVVSNLAVYNFKSRLTVQCKRRIDICAVVHIVRSKYSHQFILCCPQEYDYLFSSIQVEEICDIIVAVHKAATGNTISVEYKVEVDLSEFVLTRQEAKKIRKEHPELALKNSAEDPVQVKTKTNNVAQPSTMTQMKANGMSWSVEDATPSSKLLPENHPPSAALKDVVVLGHDVGGDSTDDLKVFKVIDELYVMKNKKTGETFALKPVESQSQTRQPRCTLSAHVNGDDRKGNLVGDQFDITSPATKKEIQAADKNELPPALRRKERTKKKKKVKAYPVLGMTKRR
ncbi:hypothetical protein SELMODRAFT_413905 [Selaginella moellendorffii]|uniref:TH1 domain-containing protein n=1 Tax=Selaginella moellendorffii TaxID=88036 RepID=D8RR04_SELML|nr:hypothetical protein SELMODRAFT_413905 [Selaginella moellendorffii]